jgi:hypothetical protein
MTDQSPVSDLLHKMLEFQKLQACSWCGEILPPAKLVKLEGDSQDDFYCRGTDCEENDLTKGRGRR